MPAIIKMAGKALFFTFILISTHAFAKEGKWTSDDKNRPSMFNNSANAPVIKRIADSIYTLISLGDYGLERDVFFNAYKGFQYLKSKGQLRKTDLLTICDYSQSINNKRLYVIDLENSRLLYNTYVSHGKNSGDEFATSFSNLDNSNKSSLGFLVTGTTYSGIAGYSLKLAGMERGINNNVAARSIVLHGSKFVNEHTMNEKGRMGKSYGCPAVPQEISKKIINTIKGGSCLFIYHPDEHYAHTSAILNAQFDLSPAVQPTEQIAKQGWQAVADIIAQVK